MRNWFSFDVKKKELRKILKGGGMEKLYKELGKHEFPPVDENDY